MEAQDGPDKAAMLSSSSSFSGTAKSQSATFVLRDQTGVRLTVTPTLLSMSLQGFHRRRGGTRQQCREGATELIRKWTVTVRPLSAEPGGASWYRRLIRPWKSRGSGRGGVPLDQAHANRAATGSHDDGGHGMRMSSLSDTRHWSHRNRSSLCRRQRSRVAGVALGSVSLLYASTKLTIKVFHHLRRQQLRAMMVQTLPVLESLGQQHWVDFGSLLGLVRGGDLILHDNDVDVVVLNPNWPELQAGLEKQLKGKYRVAAVRPSEDPSVMWLRVYSLFGMMDIYGAYDRGGSDIEIEIGRERLLDLPKDLVLPTTEISFRGKSIRVPGSARQVLQLRYGDTWMIPRYMDKGHDTIEQRKPYVKLLRAIAALGIQI